MRPSFATMGDPDTEILDSVPAAFAVVSMMMSSSPTATCGRGPLFCCPLELFWTVAGDGIPPVEPLPGVLPGVVVPVVFVPPVDEDPEPPEDPDPPELPLPVLITPMVCRTSIVTATAALEYCPSVT